MKRHLFWFGVVIALFAGLWLLVFGTATPCDAMRSTGRELARKEGGETGKVVKEAMADHNQYTTLQCVGLTLHMKISGTSAFKVIGR